MDLFVDKKTFMKLPLSEKIMNSLEVMFLGMLITVMVLLLLMLCIKILGMLFGKKKKEAESVIETLQVAETQRNDSEQINTEDDLELIVVLSAAIAAFENKPASLFHVISFKETKPMSSWRQSGLVKNMGRR